MLRRNDVHVNHKQVHRIMQLNNWLLPFHKRYRVRIGKTLPLPSGSNQYWQADFIQLHCGVDGKAYLFNILDCFDRCWVGYNLSQTCMTSDNEPSQSAWRWKKERQPPCAYRGLFFSRTMEASTFPTGLKHSSNSLVLFMKRFAKACPKIMHSSSHSIPRSVLTMHYASSSPSNRPNKQSTTHTQITTANASTPAWGAKPQASTTRRH